MSPKTDAFALGIVLVELLLSSQWLPVDDACEITFLARAFVDAEDAGGRADAAYAKAIRSGWEDANAQRAAKILCNVMESCLRGSTHRSTPSQVQQQLETAFGLAGVALRTSD